jgi:hypothetical protein
MTGVEPAPSGFTGQRSNQLSYIHHSSDRLFYLVLTCSRLPLELLRCSPPVTVRATDLAFGDFVLNDLPGDAIPHHLRYVLPFRSSDMVEF